MTPLVVIAAVCGGAWGFISDRIAARWPVHDDGSTRGIDWRTLAVVLVGIVAPALAVLRFESDAAALAYIGILLLALILLLATDLDQRLLPDVITLPIAGYAVIGFITGIGPFVTTPGDFLVAAAAAAAIPGLLFIVSIPFGAGAIGLGDLKLLFGVGLMAGAFRLGASVILGAVAAAIVIVILLALRRITLKSYVPYGPFLIIGAIWALTVSHGP